MVIKLLLKLPVLYEKEQINLQTVTSRYSLPAIARNDSNSAKFVLSQTMLNLNRLIEKKNDTKLASLDIL